VFRDHRAVRVRPGLDGLAGRILGTGEETLLVFGARQPMMASMEKPWYRKLFSRSQKPDREVTPAHADYEDADVQFGMGLKFASGEGAAQDFVQAAQWYRKAADQNHSLAQFNLGTMYANGQGMIRDNGQSVIWFGKAAQLGDAGAQFSLGKSCHRASLNGIPDDAPESRIEAYKWYRLAAAQGYDGSGTACTTLILNMTRQDVANGDRRVAEFAAVRLKPAQE
jgi:TPR repeat protein